MATVAERLQGTLSLKVVPDDKAMKAVRLLLSQDEDMARISNWRSALPRAGVFEVFGHRRQGKTALTWRLVEDAHDGGRQVVGFQLPAKAKKALTKWVKFAETIDEVRKARGAVVVCDEAALKAHARRASSDFNLSIVQLIAISGQNDQQLYYVCQHGRQLDVGIVMDADLMLFKKPSKLHILFSRPELRDVLTRVRARFEAQKGDTRRWTYVVDWHEGREGFLTNKLPTFWTDDLSRSFAASEDEAVEADVADRKRKRGAAMAAKAA